MYFILSPGPYLFNLTYFCLSFTKTLLHTLHLKCIISVVLIALRHIFLSPEPYLFHLFDLVVFYIESTLLCYLHLKCLISIMLIVLLCIFYLQDLIHSIFFDFVASYTFSTWLSFALTLLHSFLESKELLVSSICLIYLDSADVFYYISRNLSNRASAEKKFDPALIVAIMAW